MSTALRVWFTVICVLLLAACDQKPDPSGNNTSNNTVSGVITPAIAGISVQLSGASEQSTQTDANGLFEFTGVENGDYTVTPSSPDHVFSPVSQVVTVDGADVTDVDFTATEDSSGSGSSGTNSVSGAVSFNSAPLPRVTMRLIGDAESLSVITSSEGDYTFTGLANGVYTLTPSLTGFRFTPSSATFNLNNFNATGFNFIAAAIDPTPPPSQTYSLFGTILGQNNAPISGVTVVLGGDAGGSVVTDANGDFSFSGLANGNYSVTPEHTDYSFFPQTRNVIINNGDASGVDFSATQVVQTFNISGTVNDASAQPVAGVTLTLSGASAATTTSDASGNYSFSGLSDGSYVVTPSLTDYTFTPTSQGVTVNGSNVTGIDFLAQPPEQTFSISGNIAEIGVGNVSGVSVVLSGDGTAATTTDAQGNYSFSGLVNGAYSVTPSLADYTFSPANQVVNLNNADVSGVDFVAVPVPAATFSISGSVADDTGAAVAGVTMTLGGNASATTVTDMNGDYLFTGLENGSYTVMPLKMDYTFSPTDRIVIINDADVSGIDFTGTPPEMTYTLSGSISDSSAAVAGVTVSLTGDTTAETQTDAGGNYSFSGLASGSYTVTPTLTDYTFTPDNQAVLIQDADVSGIDFVAVPPVMTYLISGTIADAATPVAGVTVTLSGDSNAVVETDADGNYSFAGLASGSYTLTPTLASYTFTPVSQQVVVQDADVTGIDFEAVPPAVLSSISGNIADATPAAVAGVTVTLGGDASATTETDANGDYTFTDLVDGNYTVTPFLFDTVFTPATQNVTLNGADAAGVDFVAEDATPGRYNITGHVMDADGIAVVGLTVTLRGAVATNTTTDVNGMFRFVLLANGEYTVAPDSPNYDFAPADQVISVADADVDAVDFTATFTGTSVSISGNVSDGNLQNISGITINLTGPATNTTITDVAGNYTFNGLSPGEYTVTPEDANHSFDPVNQVLNVADADIIDVNFVATATNTFSISGNIADAGATSIEGITVALSGASTANATTDVDGNYSFTGLPNGNYTVTPESVDFSFAPVSQAVTINNADVPGVDFTATATASTFSISGNIADAVGAGLEGVTVLLDGDLNLIATSDAAGDYSFNGLASGAYIVSASMTGKTFTPSSQGVNIAAADITGVDFTAADQAAGTHNHTLFIAAGSLTINGAGGASIPAWGYSTTAGVPEFPGPAIMAMEGDTVNITVINTHDIAHNFFVEGISTNADPIPPGTSMTYSFVTDTAGTFVYHDSLNDNINREMGLYGAMVVSAAGGGNTVWTGGPAFDLQRTWVLGDMDKPRWNDVTSNGGAVNTTIYRPNYFLINGMGGFDAMADHTNTVVDGLVGETALIRIVNGGQFSQTLHFHGNHVQVLSINGIRESTPFKERDVVTVSPLGTMEVLFFMNQPGEYPMHNHTAQMETANGVYLNGVATMINMQ